MTVTHTHQPNVIDRLNVEWGIRYASTPRSWPHGEQTGDELCGSVNDASPEEREQLMRGLLEAAAGGDEDCARAVLQLMLPRFVLTAARHTRMRQMALRGDSSAQEEVAAAVIAAAWKWIRRPSLHRSGSCIGNLAMDVMKDSLLERKLMDRGSTDVDLVDWLPEMASTPDPEEETTDRSTQELCSLIAWARDEGVFTSRDAALFLRYQLSDAQERIALSEEYGYRGRSVCKRISLLHRRLTDAVRDYALQRCDLSPDFEVLMQQVPA